MTPIKKFPEGVRTGFTRIRKDDVIIDIERFIHGSRVRFVEAVYRRGQRIALRATDEFVSDTRASEFLSRWLSNRVENEEYEIVSSR